MYIGSTYFIFIVINKIFIRDDVNWILIDTIIYFFFILSTSSVEKTTKMQKSRHMLIRMRIL